MQTEFPTRGVSTEKAPMGIPKLQPRYTVDEYLTRERGAIERHIFLDGEIFAMAGETDQHGDITVNLVVAIGTQLKGKPCRVRVKDTKVRSGPVPLKGQSKKGMYSYPDLVVICDEPEFHDAHKDIILNPRVVIEVLSPSTEAFDRGEKFTRYQTCNPTLTDYILVSQDRPQIEHFRRQTEGSWSYHLHQGLNASVAITSIECTLKLVDVFDRIEFPSDEAPEQP